MERCKRRIFGGSTQSTFERRCPSSIACGGEMHTGDNSQLLAYVRNEGGRTEDRLTWIGSRLSACERCQSGSRLSTFVSFTMSAHDFDDHPRSSHESFVDLSPSSRAPHSRARSGSVGSEVPVIPCHAQRSNIQINTDLTVRIYLSNILFQSSYRQTCGSFLL